MVEKLMKMVICERECNCCIGKIYRSMKEDAGVWKEMEEMTVADTPLHKAAATGNMAVAVEILNLVPSLGRKLNEEGLSPLHLAIKGTALDAKLYMVMVRALVRFDAQLVRVKGKGGETPLMLCAATANKDDEKLLATLLIACPNSVRDVNNNQQTVVHVALAEKKTNVFIILVDWLRRRGQISSVLYARDVNGNTALHTAAQFGFLEGAEVLVDLVKLNSWNSENKTPLDVAEDYGQNEVVQLLIRKKAKRGTDLSDIENSMDEYVHSRANFFEAITRQYYYLTKGLTLELRSAVLVVATLIVAATYQGVLQPPGGVYPPPNAAAPAAVQHMRRRRTAMVSDETAALRQHLAGQMVMAKTHYRYFMPSNTFAFALSAVIIIFVAEGSPIFLILHFCLVFMCISYLLALDAIAYYTGISHVIFYLALYAIVGAFIVKLFYYPVKAILLNDDKDWWLRRLRVQFDNRCSRLRWGPGSAAAMKVMDKMKKQYSVLDL